MINIDELDDQVLSDILENLGYDQDTGEETPEEAYNKVKALSFEEAWERYCTWNGLMGSFPASLDQAYTNLKKASGKLIIEIELAKEASEGFASVKYNGQELVSQTDNIGRNIRKFWQLPIVWDESPVIDIVQWGD